MYYEVDPPLLYSGASEVVSNGLTTGSIVAGGSATVAAAVPAGADDVSILASVSSTAHAANFLAVAAVDHLQYAQFAASVASIGADWQAADAAGSAV